MAASSSASTAAVTPPKAFQLGSARIEADEIKLIGTAPIGKGMFGSVWKGECRGSEVAVKIPNRATLTPAQMQAFQTEMEVMKKIAHPHCCLFMGAHVDEKKRTLQIVTELCAGDMNKLILEDKTPYPLSQRLNWALQAARGLAWLHALPTPILHRDLKLANLLHDASVERSVKVADFGLAQVTDQSKEVWDKNPRGSLLYMGPEVYLLNNPITAKTDVFSFSLVLWEFCTRREVYEEYFEPAKFVTDCFVGGKRPPIDPSWPPKLQDLFRTMWSPEPDARPDMKQVCAALTSIIATVVREERIVFIQNAIPDPVGQQFWIDHFLERDLVPFEEFCTEFYKALLVDLPKVDDRAGGTFTVEQQKFLALRYVITADEDHKIKDHKYNVDISKFGLFLGWVGPLELPAPPSDGLLDRFVQLMRQPYFTGMITANQATDILRNIGREGSFLVRFSTRTPGGYTISVLKAGGAGVSHLIVYNEKGRGLTLEHTNHWPDIPSLVGALSADLKFPAGDGAAFRYLFSSQPIAHDSGYTQDPSELSFDSDQDLIRALRGQ